MGLADANVGDHVSKGNLAGEVTEIDEAGSIRVKWFDEKEGATWEQPVDLELVTKATEKPREEGPTKSQVDAAVANMQASAAPVFLAQGTEVKLTGRIRTKDQKEFVAVLSNGDEGTFLVQDRLFKTNVDLTKDQWRGLTRQAKKLDLALEVVEVKEPKKRLSPKERARQKEIAERRLAQLAAARKNLAKKRGTTKATKAVEASVDDSAPVESKEESESAAA